MCKESPDLEFDDFGHENVFFEATPIDSDNGQFMDDNESRAIEQSGPLPEIHRSSDMKMRACDDCRKRKITCYILDNSTKCFRCQMDDLECTFTKTQAPKTKTIRPLAQPKNNPELQGPIEDYSSISGKSLLKRTLSLQHPRSSFVVGNSGLFDSNILESIALDKNNQARISQTLSLRKTSNDSLFIVRADGGVPQWIKECDEIQHVVTPHGWALVNSYFQHAHGSYPILHEKVFLEKYSRTYRELTPALLGAVYFLALKWWYHNSELGTAARPGHLAPALYELSMAAFFRSSGRPSLSLIQAGLLLLQCSSTDPRNVAISSVIISTAYRVALNRDCSTWKLPKWEKHLRIRLSWAVYAQCKWMSLYESLPSQINDSKWSLVPLNIDYFEPDSMRPAPTAPFIHIGKLSIIVGEIHSFLQNENVIHSMEETLVAIKPMQMKLRRFYQELPTVVPNDYTDEIPGNPQHANFTLHIAYIGAEIALHRFIIAKLLNTPSADPELEQVCRSAAESRLIAATDLVKSMKLAQVQAFFHFSIASDLALIGVFAALMVTSTSDANKRLEYKRILGEHLSTLQGFSESDVVSASLQLLLSSLSGVPGLLPY